MVHIVAIAKAVAGKETELEVLLKTLVEKTRREKGCVQYDLFQDTGDARTFFFVEQWESEKDLHAHLDSSHIQAAMTQRGVLYQSLEIKSLRSIL